MGIGLILVVVWFGATLITTEDIRIFPQEIPKWLLWIGIASALLLMMNEERKWKWSVAVRLRKWRGLGGIVTLGLLLVMTIKPYALLFVPFLLYAVWRCFGLTGSGTPLGARFKRSPPAALLDVLVIVFFGLISINLFSMTLYEHVKPQFGGGHPASVSVFVAHNKRDQLANLGNVERVDSLLRDALLVDSSDLGYLVFIKTDDEGGRTLLQLDRSMVDIVHYNQ